MKMKSGSMELKDLNSIQPSLANTNKNKSNLSYNSPSIHIMPNMSSIIVTMKDTKDTLVQVIVDSNSTMAIITVVVEVVSTKITCSLPSTAHLATSTTPLSTYRCQTLLTRLEPIMDILVSELENITNPNSMCTRSSTSNTSQ